MSSNSSNSSNNSNNNNSSSQNREDNGPRKYGRWDPQGKRMMELLRSLQEIRPFEYDGRRGIGARWQEVSDRVNSVRADLPPLSKSAIDNKFNHLKINRLAED